MKHAAAKAIPITLGLAAMLFFGSGAVARADTAQACSAGQLQVSNGGEQAAAGHRRVLLVFSLVAGAPCTLTGYPGVVSGSGGPVVQADWTRAGYMGGAGPDTPPVVWISAGQPGYAVVEGAAVDSADPDHPCPTYTDLHVIPPDTTDPITVATHIETCRLQVHPVTQRP